MVAHFDHRRTAEKLARCPLPRVQRIRFWHICTRLELEDDFENGSLSANDFVRVVRRSIEASVPRRDRSRAAIADIFWPNTDVYALIPRLVPRYRLILGSNTNEIHSEQFLASFLPM